jgi:ankyrin repeat protein
VKRSFNAVRLGSHVDKPGAGGETFLTRAVKMGDHQAIRDFLEIGADADGPNARGELPLHIAMKRRDVKTMEILLNAGASVYRKQEGMTLREHALKLGMKDIAVAARRIERRLEVRAATMYHGMY